tara:strand:+ start:4256 stop:5032 length:777 start_codon:yes stop_codon:yes gene_type:complete
MSSKALIELTKNELKNTNYGRILLLEKFEQLIEFVNTEKKLKIGVIGGSKNEPEILLLEKLKFEVDVTTLGIDKDDYFLDLNEKDNDLPEFNFDLVLCGQVLEHIWNISNFVENISKVLSKETFVFVHCPKSNIHHGHTYYSSGYSKEFLEKIFSIENISIIESGELGTPRLYTSTHLVKDWLNTDEINNGKINYRTWYSFLWNLKNKKPEINKYIKNIQFIFSLKRVLVNSLLKILKNDTEDDKLIKSESYIFLQNQ